MDFASFDPAALADEGADMEVVNPATGEVFTHKGEPVTIRVRGFESRELREIARAADRKAARGIKIDMEKHGMDMLVAATLSWRGVMWDGKPLDCTPENVRMLYTERDFIGRQVVLFAKEPGNFFKDASQG